MLTADEQRALKEQVRRLIANRTRRASLVRACVMEAKEERRLNAQEWARFEDALKEAGGRG